VAALGGKRVEGGHLQEFVVQVLECCQPSLEVSCFDTLSSEYCAKHLTA
jgi:hypothetical protein